MEPALPEPRLESTVHPPEPLQLGLHEAQSVELTALSPELSEPGPLGPRQLPRRAPQLQLPIKAPQPPRLLIPTPGNIL